MSVSVLSHVVDLDGHRWSQAKWDNSVIISDSKPLFQIVFFSALKAYSLGGDLL